MVVFGAVVAVVAPAVRSSNSVPGVLTTTVRRADFDAVIVAPGRLESAQSTEIRCELERITTGTAPTILTIIDDGSIVKKGDLLCRIDSADLEEMVRR